MKVLVLPRDGNPYQELLYTELRRRGMRVRYLGGLTPSHTLNVLLLPLELLAGRLTGARIVHLHWVWAFTLPGGSRTRLLAQAWFRVVLATARLLGLRLAWTAHNVLPHQQVFANDVAARRTLVRACDLVISHSLGTLDELAAMRAHPRRAAVVPHGPYPAPALPAPGGGEGGGGRFLFLGMVAEYKGVEDLIAAFAELPSGVEASLTIAGSCSDAALAARLRELAAPLGDRVTLRLEHVPDGELAGLYGAADVVVLPFRKITTSGSALLALSYGRPLIVPDVPPLAELPDDAVRRYEPAAEPGDRVQLTKALAELAQAGAADLEAMSEAALAYTRENGWEAIGETTAEEFARIVEAPPPPAERGPRERGRLAALAHGWFRRVADDALYRGSMLLLSNTLGLAAFGFLYWTLAARTYPQAQVGWLAGVTAGVNLLATVASLGLPNTVIRHLTKSEDPRELARVTVAAVTVIGGALTVLCLLLLTPLLPGGGPNLGGDLRSVGLMTLLVVATAGGALFDAGLITMRATGALLVKNVVGQVAKVGALLALIPFGLPGLIVSYGSGTVLASVLGGIALMRRLPPDRVRLGARRVLREHLSFSGGSYLGTVFGILPSTVTPIQVLAISGSKQTALFAVAFQLAGFINFIPSTAAQVVFAEAQRGALAKQLAKAVKAIYGLLLPAVLIAIVAAPLVLRLFGDAYAEAATGCLRWLAIGALLSGGSYLVDAALIARDRTKAYIFMNGANATLVLVITALFLPHGLTAGAAGWALAQGLSVLVGAVVLATSFRSRLSDIPKVSRVPFPQSGGARR
ncbi:oligosaccharide flippase family protein [Actinomadura barringtoniae]|uniref:Oligosaccharide flippase family protein n=1 Tax=Actinomadura barringtoniae TaxID=1427535 RepID=A0A939PCI8_9ACTN|nr:glycosyltransferase [Actinomadura barringtoniae]MBO2446749.1 oligosaccharide flippase family protein [Actinomadura barringtoniae]